MISTAPRPALSAAAAPSLSGGLSIASGSVRLTRRGRLALVGLLAALAFALVSLGQVAASAGPAGSDGSADAGASTPVSTTWVVQPGETLWVIAELVDPQTDPRETVARIAAMNNLPSSSVQAGQELQIPA
ncbi:MAG: LysM peptidoglycan-binding domain-containing protein [Actinomycetia bacterium]|nr:LysM peptidoglycan-binding domain-containing protein [Actinomycetes bacterium]